MADDISTASVESLRAEIARRSRPSTASVSAPLARGMERDLVAAQPSDTLRRESDEDLLVQSPHASDLFEDRRNHLEQVSRNFHSRQYRGRRPMSTSSSGRRGGGGRSDGGADGGNYIRGDERPRGVLAGRRSTPAAPAAGIVAAAVSVRLVIKLPENARTNRAALSAVSAANDLAFNSNAFVSNSASHFDRSHCATNRHVPLTYVFVSFFCVASLRASNVRRAELALSHLRHRRPCPVSPRERDNGVARHRCRPRHRHSNRP